MNTEIKIRYIYRNNLSNRIIILRYSLEQIEKGTSNNRYQSNPNEYKLLAKELYSTFIDRNGKHIYEGDIVVDYPNKSSGWASAIEFIEGEFHLSKEHPGDRDLYELYERGRLLIIGNIHENPELLE